MPVLSSHSVYYITDKTAKLIDNIFYNGNLSNICSGILTYDLTDHLPLFIILDIENHKIKNVKKIKNKITILIIKIIY